MDVWKYTIIGNNGTIFTSNHDYAEKKSRLGSIVFCKRETNIYRH
ncbi:MAG: hypothetical protein V5A64_01065 [Candidatus Thermoplasmatota archaeon]